MVPEIHEMTERVSDSSISGAPSIPEFDQALGSGTVIENFRIEAATARDEFSFTYHALDLELGKRFVIKENFPSYFCFRDPRTTEVLPIDSDGGDAESLAWSVDNFEREAVLLTGLFNPGVIRVLRTFRALGTAYYVTPFVEGTTLAEQINSRQGENVTFSEEEITGLIWRLLNGLEFLHAKKLYHQDIRPSNILITEQGIPLLTNFCAARRALCERFLSVMEISPYMPPEQLVVSGNIGPWSDLFSLGAILMEAIGGRAISGQKNVLPVRGALRENYSDSLLHSLDKAVESDISSRFQNAAEWRQVLWGLPVAEEQAPVSDPQNKQHVDSRDEEVGIDEFPSFEDDFFESIVPNSERVISPLRILAGIALSVGLISGLIWLSTILEQSNTGGAESEPVVVFEDTERVVADAPVSSALSEVVESPEEGPAVEYLIEVMAEPSPKPVLKTEPVAPIVPPASDKEVEVMEGTIPGESKFFGGVELQWCPPGEFQMGSPWNEKGRFIDETPHSVRLTQGYWMARTETTQSLWKRIMGSNPSAIKGENLPVERVSWLDVQVWIEKMNTNHPPPTGWEWKLPTEAQWEYACRAGTTTAVYGGEIEILGERNAPILDAIAWYGGNSSVGYVGEGFDTSEWPQKQYPGGMAGVREVGGRAPNAWGLHDMLGNVWEWCRDWVGEYPLASVTNPTGPPVGELRVMRGGSWGNGAVVCRAAVRGGDDPAKGGDGLGFRVAIVSVSE